MARIPHRQYSSKLARHRRPGVLAAVLGGSAAILLVLYVFSILSRSTPPFTECSGDLSTGKWIRYSGEIRLPQRYDATCPFHRNSWNCIRNGREGMDAINSWVWAPHGCGGAPLPRIESERFLGSMRGKKIGLVGDSLNENLVVAFLCILRSADKGAKKWKRRGAWRGGYFPKFDVTVAYHRAVLLSRYQWQPLDNKTTTGKDGLKGIYRVDVDVPADDWINITSFYDVLVFNTGHWWGFDKFPKETPLVFFRDGTEISPPLGFSNGLKVVVESMASFIKREIPKHTLVLWRSQSPRHFYGGDWDRNGSCMFTTPLSDLEE